MPVSRRTVEPYWKSECGRATVYVGKNEIVMPSLPADHFQAVVTDPPYGLEFDVGDVRGDWDAPWKHTRAKDRRADEMDDPVKAKYLRHNVEYVREGKAFQQWFEGRAADILRVAKPGAHLLSFGGTRMYHRMTCAVEDAGWEIRDCLMWVYSSGYPKGRDISKDIDKLLGADRRVVSTKEMTDTTKVRPGFTGNAHAGEARNGAVRDVDITEPATDAARAWDGWNTTLKPAWEPILVARKELCGAVAQNTLDHGCGGMNVRACTTPSDEVLTGGGGKLWSHYRDDTGERAAPRVNDGGGRWPANLVHDGMDPQLCRYFYAAKAGADPNNRPHGKGATAHPTVKPLDLMRWLVRLVAARGALVLDPFMGSGSTGVAALEEGVRFVGIEQSAEYADIAVGRLKLALASVPACTDSPLTAPALRKTTDRPPPPSCDW